MRLYPGSKCIETSQPWKILNKTSGERYKEKEWGGGCYRVRVGGVRVMKCSMIYCVLVLCSIEYRIVGVFCEAKLLFFSAKAFFDSFIFFAWKIIVHGILFVKITFFEVRATK